MHGAKLRRALICTLVFLRTPVQPGSFKNRSFWLVDLFLAESAPKNGKSRTQTINDFLVHKLLDQAAPRFNPRSASLTVGELLDRTSANLKGEFENRPAVEASIRRTIGSAYQSLGLYDRAEPHFQVAIASIPGFAARTTGRPSAMSTS